MTRMRNRLILVAAGGSAALLLGAFGFQLMGYAPCELCLLQRWPHAAAVALGILALALPRLNALALLGALAAAGTGALGVYHTGVERGWWQGPDTCTSGPINGLSPQELMNRILDAPLVQCDQIDWQFLTLSMASWNAILSFGLALVWLLAWRYARAPGPRT